MKLLTLIVKPSKTELVKEALHSSGIGGATIIEASGYGSQKGQSETYRGTEYRADTNPKTSSEIVMIGGTAWDEQHRSWDVSVTTISGF